MRPPATAELGHRPALRTVGPLSQTDVVRFAGAGGDFNPLHHDPDAARAAGFDRPIAMGQLTAALLAGWLTDWCGVENLRAYSVRFTAPLYLGDIVVLQGEVVDVQPAEDDLALAVLDLMATRDSTTVLTGRATVLVAAP